MKHSIPDTHQRSAIMRPLSPWNPLDYPKLLWWLCVTPQQLRRYRQAYGLRHERQVTKWLTNTLMWLPLLLPMLACAMRTLPFTYDGKQPDFIKLCITIGLLWFLGGILSETPAPLAILSFMTTLLGFLYTFVIVLVHSTRTAAGEVTLLFPMLFLIYETMMITEALIHEALTTDREIPLMLNGPYLLGLVLIFSREMTVHPQYGRLTLPRFLQKSVATGKPSVFGILVLGTLTLAYSFITWVSLFNGWQITSHW